MADEAKHKHLDYIQGIINRLGNNSFLIKGWTVTLVAGIFALSVDDDKNDKIDLLIISVIPVVLFWILDGYFLWQERLFRELYKDVSKQKNEYINFQMNVGPYISGRNTWMKSIFSKTMNIFYLSLLFIMSLVIGFLVFKP